MSPGWQPLDARAILGQDVAAERLGMARLEAGAWGSSAQPECTPRTEPDRPAGDRGGGLCETLHLGTGDEVLRQEGADIPAVPWNCWKGVGAGDSGKGEGRVKTTMSSRDSAI